MWWHTLACLAAGAFFLVRGLRGRYVGGEPRCKSCAYELTGLPDVERCPECGTSLTPKAVVHGRRRRRWTSLAFATLVIPVLWMSSKQFFWDVWHRDWYAYYPTRMVLRDAKAERQRGIGELFNRAKWGRVSRRQARDIADFALAEHAQWPLGAYPDGWAAILESLARHRLLTPDQGDRFFSAFARASLTVRRVIRAGDPLVMRVNFQSSRAGLYDYRFWHDPIEVRLNGRVVHAGAEDDWRHREPDWHRSDWSPVVPRNVIIPTPDLPTGKLALAYTGRHVFLAPGRSWSKAEPTWSQKVHLLATVEVLASDAADPVQWIEAPDLERELEALFYLGLGEYGTEDEDGQVTEYVRFDADDGKEGLSAR